MNIIIIILPDCVLSVNIEGDMLSVVMKLTAGHQTLSGHRSLSFLASPAYTGQTRGSQ